MRCTVVASAAIAAGAGLAARELGFHGNAWSVIFGLATFFVCIAHERLARR